MRPRSTCDAPASAGPACGQVVTDAESTHEGRSSTTSPAARTSSSAGPLDWQATWAAARVDGAQSPGCGGRHPAGSSRPLVDDWAADLEARDFARGCPPRRCRGGLRRHQRDGQRRAADTALETWRRPLTEALVDLGRPPPSGRRALDPDALCPGGGHPAGSRPARHRSPASRRPRAGTGARRLTPDRERAHDRHGRRIWSAVGVAGRSGIAALPATACASASGRPLPRRPPPATRRRAAGRAGCPALIRGRGRAGSRTPRSRRARSNAHRHTPPRAWRLPGCASRRAARARGRACWVGGVRACSHCRPSPRHLGTTSVA